MQPVVSMAEMTAYDAAALESTPQETLIRRAGMAVGFGVIEFLNGVSGKRITVLAGPGANGADGRVAGAMLTRRGAKVTILGTAPPTDSFDDTDLVIDAAFGTGLSRAFEAPAIPEGIPVVAVDLPSGLNGDTGESFGRPLQAALTITMAAMKTGLLLGDGPRLAGKVVVADIGIPTPGSRAELVNDLDLAFIPQRKSDANKWSAAVTVVAGSTGMEGAAALCSMASLRAGSGMVRLVTLAQGSSTMWPEDVVRKEVSPDKLLEVALFESSRCKAMVIGPGLGLDDVTQQAIREIVNARTCPVVLDADGITAMSDLAMLRRIVSASPHPMVITPHDGELARLLGHELDRDRMAMLNELAQETGVIVLSKGATTVVVAPENLDPIARFVTEGTPSLATAGTGDVLGGVIAAFCAQGLDLPQASALGAFVHGKAGSLASGTLVATDLPNLVGTVLEEGLS